MQCSPSCIHGQVPGSPLCCIPDDAKGLIVFGDVGLQALVDILRLDPDKAYIQHEALALICELLGVEVYNPDGETKGRRADDRTSGHVQTRIDLKDNFFAVLLVAFIKAKLPEVLIKVTCLDRLAPVVTCANTDDHDVNPSLPRGRGHKCAWRALVPWQPAVAALLCYPLPSFAHFS